MAIEREEGDEEDGEGCERERTGNSRVSLEFFFLFGMGLWRDWPR